MRREELNQDNLKSIVRYESDTGQFFYVIDGYNNTYRVGDKAGHSDGSSGYLKMNLFGRKYRMHRLAWLYVHGCWPAHHIDHINGVRSDNRIANLRDVPQRLNAQNQKRPSLGATGVRGVTRKPSGKFAAQITVDYKNIVLGLFNTPEEAGAVYQAARKTMHQGYVE